MLKAALEGRLESLVSRGVGYAPASWLVLLLVQTGGRLTSSPSVWNVLKFCLSFLGRRCLSVLGD